MYLTIQTLLNDPGVVKAVIDRVRSKTGSNLLEKAPRF